MQVEFSCPSQLQWMWAMRRTGDWEKLRKEAKIIWPLCGVRDKMWNNENVKVQGSGSSKAHLWTKKVLVATASIGAGQCSGIGVLQPKISDGSCAAHPQLESREGFRRERKIDGSEEITGKLRIPEKELCDTEKFGNLFTHLPKGVAV